MLAEDIIVATKEVQEKIAPYAVATPAGADPVIEEAFITGTGELTSSKQLMAELMSKHMRCFDNKRIHAEEDNSPLVDVAKFIEGSTQSSNELRESFISDLSQIKVVKPPYSAELLSMFLEVDEVHYRCVKAKVTDFVGRDWDIRPLTMPSGEVYDPSQLNDSVKKSIQDEIVTIRSFVEECNDVIGFDGVLTRAAMDFESIGYGAIEIIRSRDGKIARLAHIPASRVRVLRGWKGFVEVIAPEKYMYYQPFGWKIVSKNRRDLVTIKAEPYNPRLDGPLNMSNLDWSMIDRETGKPTVDFDKAANELIWMPKHHPNTVYYGVPDIVAALGHVFSNIYIRDYLLQFFQYNTIPQYAIIIEGAKLAAPVKETILKFFSEEVKGKAHRTLIIPVPAMGAEVKVRFEKLAADTREGSFQETRKNGSQGIMTAHGVSPAIIGVADNANLGSGKGLSQAEIYKDRVVTPGQRRWERSLNKLFRLGLGVRYVGLTFDRLDIRDLLNEMSVYTGYQKEGIVTINEVRQQARLGDSLEGGDRAFFKGNQMPVFIDELTEASGIEMEQLQSEIDGMKTELKNRDQLRSEQPNKESSQK